MFFQRYLYNVIYDVEVENELGKSIKIVKKYA